MAVLMFVPDIGEFVEVDEDLLGIVAEIQRRWPELTVKFHNGHDAGINEPPFVITEIDKLGIERIVMRVWQLDGRVIQQLEASDTYKIDVLKRIEAEAAKARKAAEDAKAEKHEEAKDVLLHTIRNPKTSYTIPAADGEGVIKVSDG